MIDERPLGRVRDPRLLSQLHFEWDECAICGASDSRLSLHHISKHPRDDVKGNLVMLCGSGTTGCHGLIEAYDWTVLETLGQVLCARADVVEYLDWRLGSLERVQDWLQAHYRVSFELTPPLVSGLERGSSEPLSLSGDG